MDGTHPVSYKKTEPDTKDFDDLKNMRRLEQSGMPPGHLEAY